MDMRGTDFAHRNTSDVLTITLGTEGESFDLKLMVPTKGIYDGLMHAAELIDHVADEGSDPAEVIDELMGLIARAMSHNTIGKEITPEFLDEMKFDFECASIFMMDYIYFITSLITAKN